MSLVLDGGFRPWSHRLHKFVIRQLIKEIEPYHPISIDDRTVSSGERGCADRWAVIREVLSASPNTVLDLGCAEGYFVSRAAREFGCFVLGVDADLRRLTIAQELSILNKNEGAGYMYAHITPEFLEKLPLFDVVILLAVLHHVMYEHGVDYARRFMEGVRKKTSKSLIFEMGQSDETSMYWSTLLPNMGSDPHAWIEEFLRSCGFSKVIRARETDAYQSPIRRCVFVAHP